MLNIEKELSDIKFVEYIIAIIIVGVICFLIYKPNQTPVENNTVDTIYIGYNDSLLNTIDSLQHQIDDNIKLRKWNYNSLNKKITKIGK